MDNNNLNSLYTTLSAEDLAWADSCLIEDPDISETNMDSLKEALLQILDQHSETHSTSANEHGNNSNDKIDPENSHLVLEEEVTSHAAGKSVDQDVEQESYDAVSILKKQPFLPNFHDEMMNMRYSDDDEGFLVSEFVTEPLPDEDIFKVWDLDIPVEEDELVKELTEALSSDADKAKGLKTESVDRLVESIADLSIK